jgi:hypothetical protein
MPAFPNQYFGKKIRRKKYKERGKKKKSLVRRSPTNGTHIHNRLRTVIWVPKTTSNRAPKPEMHFA